MKYTKVHQQKWDRFKKEVLKKKKRLHIYTKWSFQLDKNTKDGNLRITYSIPIQIERDGELIERNKQQKIYLKNRTFKDLDILLSELQDVDNRVNKLRDDVIENLQGGDGDEIEFWIEKYLNRDKEEIKSIGRRTIESDKSSLYDYLSWLKDNKPNSLSIYNLTKELLLQYFTHRSKVGGVSGKKWRNGSIRTSYRRIRGFYNWMARKTKLELEVGKLNNMDMPKVQVVTESFSPSEIKKISEFMNKEKKHREWGWFIPMLRTLLLTGCRLSEVVNMKIEDIDIDNREWYFKGKGSKFRKTAFRDNELWKEIKSRIMDKDGKMFDKKYVFHMDYWKQGFKGIKGYKKGTKGIKGDYELGFQIVDYQRRFTTSGVYHKFKKMVEQLSLNEKLSPHSCRRFFITEMLKKTNGNIPLVAQLVGHSTWDVVRMYSKSVISEDTPTNINLKEIVSKTN